MWTTLKTVVANLSLLQCRIPCTGLNLSFATIGAEGVLHNLFYRLDMPKSKRSAQKRFILKVPLNQGHMQCDCCARPKHKEL